MSPRARVNRLRLSLVVAVVVVLLAGASVIGYLMLNGQTVQQILGGPSSSGPTVQPTEAPITLGEIPLTTTVVKVAGPLAKKDKALAEQQIDELLTRYVSTAYLGLYPRQDFSSAFALMAPDLVKYAKNDADVIAGQQWSTQSVSVDSGSLTAKVSLLAVKKKPVGATAKVTWTFEVTPLASDSASGASTASEPSPTAASSSATTGTPMTVTVEGRILLVTGSSGWQIFGYDVAAPDATPLSATGSTTTGSTTGGESTATGGSGT